MNGTKNDESIQGRYDHLKTPRGIISSKRIKSSLKILRQKKRRHQRNRQDQSPQVSPDMINSKQTKVQPSEQLSWTKRNDGTKENKHASKNSTGYHQLQEYSSPIPKADDANYFFLFLSLSSSALSLAISASLALSCPTCMLYNRAIPWTSSKISSFCGPTSLPTPG